MGTAALVGILGAIMAISLGALVLLVRRAYPRGKAPRTQSRLAGRGRPKAPVQERASKEACEATADAPIPAPQADAVPPTEFRRRRLVTDVPIQYDPLAKLGNPGETRFAEVEAALEAALDEQQRGDISIEGYRTKVAVQERRVRNGLAQIAELEPSDRELRSRELESALGLVEYCFMWADQQSSIVRRQHQ